MLDIPTNTPSLSCFRTQTTHRKWCDTISQMQTCTAWSYTNHGQTGRASHWWDHQLTPPQVWMAIPHLLGWIWTSPWWMATGHQRQRLWSPQLMVSAWWQWPGWTVAFPQGFTIIFASMDFNTSAVLLMIILFICCLKLYSNFKTWEGVRILTTYGTTTIYSIPDITFPQTLSLSLLPQHPCTLLLLFSKIYLCLNFSRSKRESLFLS